MNYLHVGFENPIDVFFISDCRLISSDWPLHMEKGVANDA